ncbi:MAG: hypothetical protein EOP08_16725 [Proteobacteria bacterium]|nr:MAG: hypothetical protein EOP08_16725 [Pseudomonadota bacterium]
MRIGASLTASTFDISGHEGYITVGLYEDGTPGEVFITMSKEGSTIGGLMDSLATLVSVALQYGVPVESLVRKFEHTRFEPSGMTRNRDIPIAKSPVDYIFRWLAMEFIDGYRANNAPERPKAKVSDSVDEDTVPASPGQHHAKVAGTGTGNVAESRLESIDPALHGKVIDTPARSRTGPAHGKAYETQAAAVLDPLSQQGRDAQSDAPPCDVCGSITVRSGTCYKCLNCGNSMGCS